MKKQYHILNGDALKARFPQEIEGEVIIMRECMVDGPVKGEALETLYANRASFIAEHYEGCTMDDYYQDSVGEFEKIQAIPEGAIIFLWFEDDLFCQVNFWFVANLLVIAHKKYHVLLVRPKKHTAYGFGGLNHEGLMEVFKAATSLVSLETISSLWKAYQQDDRRKMEQIAHSFIDSFPFISNAIQAHLERIPTASSMGRPEKSLLAIMKKMGIERFGPVFQAFNQQESIYGFGDVQVKRMFDTLKKQVEG